MQLLVQHPCCYPLLEVDQALAPIWWFKDGFVHVRIHTEETLLSQMPNGASWDLQLSQCQEI